MVKDDYIYFEYINFCKKLKSFNIKKNNKIEIPYVSICLPIYNMENYIEKALFSILNQSFKKYEIILINDFSTDKTNNIIKSYQKKESKIKIINHKKNLGTFVSRVDGFLNSNSEFIIFMDPDDLLLNPYLLEKLYNFNLKYNLDIIEYTVFYENQEKKKLYMPDNHKSNHYHHFEKEIIYQPELSNLLFYEPNSITNFSYVFCRTIWNKMIRKKVLLKVFNTHMILIKIKIIFINSIIKMLIS